MAEVHIIVALAELLRQGGLLALVAIEGFIIYKLYSSRDALYDRLIAAKEDDRVRSDNMTERVVTALGRSTAVVERIEAKKFGELPPAKSVPSARYLIVHEEELGEDNEDNEE